MRKAARDLSWAQFGHVPAQAPMGRRRPGKVRAVFVADFEFDLSSVIIDGPALPGLCRLHSMALWGPSENHTEAPQPGLRESAPLTPKFA